MLSICACLFWVCLCDSPQLWSELLLSSNKDPISLQPSLPFETPLLDNFSAPRTNIGESYEDDCWLYCDEKLPTQFQLRTVKLTGHVSSADSSRRRLGEGASKPPSFHFLIRCVFVILCRGN